MVGVWLLGLAAEIVRVVLPFVCYLKVYLFGLRVVLVVVPVVFGLGVVGLADVGGVRACEFGDFVEVGRELRLDHDWFLLKLLSHFHINLPRILLSLIKLPLLDTSLDTVIFLGPSKLQTISVLR